MSDSQSPYPFVGREQLIEMLHEQGATLEESADLLPVLQRLPDWQAPQPKPAETQRLLARLAAELPAHSQVRQAIREHRQHRISLLLATARAQVSIFGLGFWLVSAVVTAIGAAVVLTKVLPDQQLVLRASGPLLAYVGTIAAFRGRGERVLELELACLPSPLQLAVSRLVIVLGYDVALGLVLSMAFWVSGTGQVLDLTLSWLMPLLLVAGLALVLSLRLSIQAATALAYASWLGVLAIMSTSNLASLLATPELSMLGGIGLLLLFIALLRLGPGMHRLLPQT